MREAASRICQEMLLTSRSVVRFVRLLYELDRKQPKHDRASMAATIEQLTHDALGLSELDRAHLAKTLLGSLEADTEEVVHEAWDAEVARRLERLRQGAAQGRPADQVFHEIRARHEA
jgi:putative addiction module component (TIGR02574 family)